MKKFEVGNFPVGGATIKNDSFKLVLPQEIQSLHWERAGK